MTLKASNIDATNKTSHISIKDFRDWWFMLKIFQLKKIPTVSEFLGKKRALATQDGLREYQLRCLNFKHPDKNEEQN